MKIAILGYGSQGRAAYEYWNKPGNQLTICDMSETLELPEGVASQLGAKYLIGLDKFDLLVRGPSIYPPDIAAANPDAPNILSKVTTVTNEFFKVCPSRNLIGVTGTKGKGTTSTLIARTLEAAGKKVHLGGNIGTPPLDMLKAGIQPDDWVVLELANFQLIDLKYSPPLAVCVMVVPEHLDWHVDLDDYIKAKQQLFAHQTADDTMVFNRANAHSQEVTSVSRASHKVSYEVPGPAAEPRSTTGAYVKGEAIFMGGTEVCKVSDVALIGHHNLENVCAALAASWDLIDHNAEIFKKVVSEFKGLPYRLELIAEVQGVKYYDDSLGTTPETATVALQAFSQPKVVILGGSDKGAEFDELAQTVVGDNVRAVVIIGKTGPAIEAALKQAGYEHVVHGGETMPQIVTAAQAQAQPGDVVLLATACASFDMFKNYQDRGDQFNAAVRALAAA